MNRFKRIVRSARLRRVSSYLGAFILALPSLAPSMVSASERHSYEVVRIVSESPGHLLIDGAADPRIGSIIVESWDSSSTRIDAHVTSSGSGEPAPGLAVVVSSDAAGGHVRASDLNEVYVSYIVHVPRTTAVTVSIENGKLSVAHLGGPVDASVRNGALRLTDLQATTSAHVGNGSVAIETGACEASPTTVSVDNGSVDMRVRGNRRPNLIMDVENGRPGTLPIRASTSAPFNLEKTARGATLRMQSRAEADALWNVHIVNGQASVALAEGESAPECR